MASGGNVNITVVDGGSATIVVPGSSTQLVIGCCSSGTVGQIVATRSATTLQSTLGFGPLVEAAALACVAGGTVLAIKATTATLGKVWATTTALNIASSTNATPIVVTTSSPHGLASGATVSITSHTVNTNANGTWIITNLTSTTFSLNGSAGNGVGGATGTVTPSGVTQVGTGLSAVTLTLDGTNGAFDDYYVLAKIVTGGTVGTAGITFQLSLDAGRNFGPIIALGTATTYVIPNTGITLNFQGTQTGLSSPTLVAADQITFGTVAPTWNTAGIQAALNSFQASQYSIQGVGSTHIVGVCNGANASTIEGYLDTLATGYIYTRAFMTARDASPATKWGGTGESEATWMSAIQTDYASTTARRICDGAAYWNMPSAFPQPSTIGAPAYRRPIAWAAAARQVTIPPQRHLGRFRDGNISQIVINSATDPLDGFIYHDERINPGLDYVIAGSGGRFMSTMTRTGTPGVFITNPLMLSPLGSDFFLMPFGNVMDVFCGIVHTSAQKFIDDDVRSNANGTIYENDARAIETQIAADCNAVLFNQKMISQPIGAGPSATGSSIIVDRTTNIRSTNQVNLTGTIVGKSYVLSESVTLSFLNPNAAV